MNCKLSLALSCCLGVAACQGSESEAGEETAASSSEDSEGSEGSESATSESGTETEGTSTETETDTDTETETETDTDTGEPEGNLLFSDEVLNIAHRGGGRLRPEATLVAFENALAVGADILEFDIHSSSDGMLVILHDDTVDRTTDGSGVVHDISFDELRALDAGYAFSPDGGTTHPYRDMGIQIPTPEEVFENFPDRYYLIEIKQTDPSIAADLVELLGAQGVKDRTVVASFDQTTIEEVRALDPEVHTAMSGEEMIVFTTQGSDPGYEPPCAFIQPPWEFVDDAMVELAHGLELKIHPWTANSEALMQDLVNYGVDGIMTDDPVLLDSVL